MNNQKKAITIILYLIWPISALFVGIRNFDTKFGKKLLIALYAFLGFTAISTGDLVRYESEFYENRSASLRQVFNELVSLQTGKFYNRFISELSGIVFESHHFYFLLLFLVYGYFYINTIYLLKGVSYNNLSKFGLLFFLGVLMFLLVRPIINNAYYTGGVFLIYLIVNYYKSNNTKYLWLMLLSPLFHIGLAVYLIVPLLLILFKNKTWLYVFFVVATFIIGKSSVVGVIEGLAESNSDTILESKYKNYASEDGQAYLDERYADGAASSNIKLRSLVFITDAILYFLVPLGMFLLFIKRKYLLVDKDLKRLFHIVLVFWGISNLMLNISQGPRFVVLHSFIAIALFFLVYIKSEEMSIKTIFSKFLYLFVPVLFVFGLMTAYASNVLFSIQFFISNFFIEIFHYSF